jgi:Mg/Co/Ni transporter MgtE
MTTDFVSLDQAMTALEALESVRREAAEKEGVYYFYVTDAEGALKGVVSLRELIVARPGEKVAAVMAEHPVTVPPDADIEAIASTAAKYNLLAVRRGRRAPAARHRHRRRRARPRHAEGLMAVRVRFGYYRPVHG